MLKFVSRYKAEKQREFLLIQFKEDTQIAVLRLTGHLGIHLADMLQRFGIDDQAALAVGTGGRASVQRRPAKVMSFQSGSS